MSSTDRAMIDLLVSGALASALMPCNFVAAVFISTAINIVAGQGSKPLDVGGAGGGGKERSDG